LPVPHPQVKIAASGLSWMKLSRISVWPLPTTMMAPRIVPVSPLMPAPDFVISGLEARRVPEPPANTLSKPLGSVSGAVVGSGRRGAGVGRVGGSPSSPEALARKGSARRGAARRIEALEAGPGSRERLLERLGPGTVEVRSLADLQA